jgi:hypothetical protein
MNSANDSTYASVTSPITVVAWTKTGKRTSANGRSARSWGLAVTRNGVEWISRWRTSDGFHRAIYHAARIVREVGQPSRWDHDVWGEHYAKAG